MKERSGYAEDPGLMLRLRPFRVPPKMDDLGPAVAGVFDVLLAYGLTIEAKSLLGREEDRRDPRA